MQSNFKTDKSQIKKIDLNRFKSVLIPLKLKQNQTGKNAFKLI